MIRLVKIELTVCNVCKAADRETTPYIVGVNGAAESVDLCSEHGAPIQAILATIYGAKVDPTEPEDKPRRRAAKKATPTKATTGRGRTPVMTLEQIEQRKREQAQKK